jgi:hypothetical protein
MKIMSEASSRECNEVAERLAEICEGSADERLYEHVAGCDHCRDLRHDAERALAELRRAGDDYRAPKGLERAVLAAVDAARAEADEDGEADEPGAAHGNGDPTSEREPEALPVARKAGARRAVKWGGPERRVTLGVLALALAAAAAVVIWARRPPAPNAKLEGAWRGKLARVVAAEGEGLRACDPSGKSCNVLSPGAELASGSRLVTDARTRAELVLSDGSRLTLDRATVLALLADGARHAELVRGNVICDIAPGKTAARFELPRGSVTVHGTKFALRSDGAGSVVEVARGSVTLADPERQSVRVLAGETGRLEPGAPPFVGVASTLGEALAWSEESFDPQERSEGPRGLGELRAKKPGQDAEQEGAVRLASHSVRVRIAGAVARTEIEEVFENQTSDVLEGIYRFPLPPDAQIERLALEVDGKLEEGAFVERDRAAAIWRGAIQNAAPKQPRPIEEIVWVPGPWRDPALLEWQRGGRFELRIFPIPKRGSRRVILAYTEVVKASGGSRRYTYPLAYDPSGRARVGRFDVDVEVRGHDPKLAPRVAGYALEAGAAADGASTLRLSEQGFLPSGDLSVEYALPDRASELTAWAFFDAAENARAADQPARVAAAPGAAAADFTPYVALALRPALPRSERNGPRSIALVVDSSRSMFGESYRRATDLAVRLARELDPSDRVSVLACGVECRALPGGAVSAGPVAAGEIRRFLDGIQPEDGSDLVAATERALATLSGDADSRRVIYIGDGAPTVGQVRPGSVERALSRAVAARPASVVAVAVGGESDQATLAALARGGAGVLVPYVPGRSVLETAYAVIGASSGNALSDVSVTLPPGLRAVAPQRLDAIPAGGEALVLARMDTLALTGELLLKGKLGGRPFEQRYPLRLTASESRGNAFVPRLYAAARIADLEREGTAPARAEAIELSSRFDVASRYTSLLVLESEAMFRAFGLDNRRSTLGFTGEEAAESESSSGLDDVDPASSEPEADGTGLGLSGIGRGGGGTRRDAASGPANQAPGGLGDLGRTSRSTAAATAAPKPASPPAPAAKKAESALEPSDPWEFREPARPRRMIPMRRVWQRHGELSLDRLVPKAASSEALAVAASELARDENRREALKKLFKLSLQAGDLLRAAELAERWGAKEPLDPEAITAHADVLAGRGEREAAIRVLGGVVDVRPGDVAAQKRLARLARWAGRRELGCRYAIAIAEMRQGDAQLLADALRCARETGSALVADELAANADPKVNALAQKLLGAPAPDERALKGDLRVEASWSGGADLDLALIDPDGHRISWLGAPTRALISARDVFSTSAEALAVSGGKPGEYAIEVVRTREGGRASGELSIHVAGTNRRIPFALDGTRVQLGVAKIFLRSELVPL